MNRVVLMTAIVFAIGTATFLIRLHPAPHTPARDAIGNTVMIGGAVGYEHGTGPLVIMVPSAGREASDFNELASDVVNAGYRVISLDPLGVGSDLPDIVDMTEFAHPVIEAMSEPSILIGHAFGNRVVRMAAHQNPAPVNGVILLAAGGQKPINPKADDALRNVFHPLRFYKSRMTDMRYAFFAGDNPVPDHWTRGWHTKTAIAQGQAVANTTDPMWQAAGGVPILIVQPLQDKIAPKEDTADLLKARYPDQVDVILIDNAGHALLPEQPEKVSQAVLTFLATHHPLKQEN